MFSTGTGNHLGLTLILNVENQEYFCSSTSSFGFKVLLHSPNEQPKLANFGISVPNGYLFIYLFKFWYAPILTTTQFRYETHIAVTPVLSEASNNVRHVDQKKRQCLFENENFLSFYR